ncbi:MAG: hypothetical protein C4523_12260 [Myxococcales bacterium]|nr:MAG: hypothetical protein C4523_12260 [Myxococcales bacterium]
MPFSPSDLDDLLLKGRDDQPSGRNRLFTWDLLTLGESVSDQAALVSLHESLHSTLTDTTAYGSLLHVYADLAGRLPEEKIFLRTFRALLDRCRITHESYATYLSMMIMGQGKPDTGLLENYPDYLRYYRIGEVLGNGFSGSYLRHSAAAAALRLCMQGTAAETALVRGLRDFRLSDIRHRDYPDQRLKALSKEVSAKFWQEAYERAKRVRPDFPAWAVFDASESDDGLYEDAVAEEFDEASRYLLESFHDALAGLLNDVGLASLSWDGQREFTARLLDKAKELTPPGSSGFFLRPAAKDETADSLVAIQFGMERLIVNPEPPDGLVRRLAEVPVEELRSLISSAAPDEHFFLSVRPARRMVEQVALNPENRQLFDSYGSTPVAALRICYHRETDVRRVVEYYLIESPEELLAFAATAKKIAPILGCFYLSSLVDAEWVRRWFDPLATAADLAYLMDIPPFANFPVWFDDANLRVKYAVVHLTVDQSRHDVLVFRSEAGRKKVLLLPGSSVMWRAVAYFLREQFPHPEIFIEDATFLQDHAWELQVVLGHLFREESFFDFGGLTIQERAT